MSAQAPMGECCVSGKLHSKQHNLAGHDQTIDGVPTYVSEPANKSKAKTMVVLTDSKLLFPLIAVPELTESSLWI